jgi:hypothetical protein
MITFSSCFYIIKSKFPKETYIQWMNQFISIVNNFYLVIYTDKYSFSFINTNGNTNIKVVVKPVEHFFHYKYKKNWIQNHENNFLLNNKIDWKINMLWSEKIWFVNETIQKKYFDTEWYGWCDIGYFRNNKNNSSTNLLQHWPSESKLNSLSKEKIHYACIQPENGHNMKLLNNIILNKNDDGLPINPIPPNQNSVAGGFFIIHPNTIEWWKNKYELKLKLYFDHNYLVKDDQIILIDCILSEKNKFQLHYECDAQYDNWFMFQRILL